MVVRCIDCYQGRAFHGIFFSTVMKDLDCATNGRLVFLLLGLLFDGWQCFGDVAVGARAGSPTQVSLQYNLQKEE